MTFKTFPFNFLTGYFIKYKVKNAYTNMTFLRKYISKDVQNLHHIYTLLRLIFSILGNIYCYGK